MQTTIIIDHPFEKSFNHAILEEIVEGLKENSRDYYVIDLHKDGFNPVMSATELKNYHSGETTDALVKRYIDWIKATDQLVLIFPIWWYSCPAGLKGFMDKVFLNGVAFEESEEGIKPLLTVKHTRIFSTSEQSTDGIYAHSGDSFRNQIETTLSDIGCQNIEWFNLGEISKISQEKRVAYLDDVYDKLE